jgi:hypothetical protein
MSKDALTMTSIGVSDASNITGAYYDLRMHWEAIDRLDKAAFDGLL